MVQTEQAKMSGRDRQYGLVEESVLMLSDGVTSAQKTAECGAAGLNTTSASGTCT